MRLVETAVLEVAVEEEGPADGRPILLLHGWPDAPRGWGPVARRLQERGWRTIVPALRGSGATRFRYTLAAVAPERVKRDRRARGSLSAARRLHDPGLRAGARLLVPVAHVLEAGAQAVATDPVGFARFQWETWSPPGWFDDEEFDATAETS